MPERTVPLCAGETYHIYNRGHNRERIFFERENYLFFLRRLREHLAPVLDIITYCLMPTHYHLMAQVRAQTPQTSEVSENLGGLGGLAVSNAMMRFSVSYTKAINKRYNRVGALFQGAFQAKHVDHIEYLVHLSRYIHLNPLIAGLVERPEEWEFSSYLEYIGLRNGTLPQSEIVLSQFPSPEAYREFAESYAPGEVKRIVGLLFDED